MDVSHHGLSTRTVGGGGRSWFVEQVPASTERNKNRESARMTRAYNKWPHTRTPKKKRSNTKRVKKKQAQAQQQVQRQKKKTRQKQNVPFVTTDVSVSHVSRLPHEVLELGPAHALGQAGDANLVARAGGGASGSGGAVASPSPSAIPAATTTTTPESTPAPASTVAAPLVRLFTAATEVRDTLSTEAKEL